MTVYDPPSAFCVKSYSLNLIDKVSIVRGVYSQREHVLDFGSELWQIAIEFHSLRAEQAGVLLAYLDRLREPDNIARFGLPAKTETKFGTTTATQLTATADVLAGGRTIPVSGVGAGTFRWGSMVQIGNYFYRNRSNFASDAGSLAVTPRLRSDVTTGDLIEIESPKSHWRLDGMPVERHTGKWTVDLSASFTEALNFS